MRYFKLLTISIIALLMGIAAQAQIYQLPNPGFEQWDGSTLSGDNASEPTGWNTFGGADGSVATSFATGGTAKKNHHAHRYGGRPGTSGSSYLTIWSKSAFGVIANGNMTTGRIHIGSSTATNLTKNYNYTARSASGFNQPFNGTPDSMYVWISYWAASASSQGSFSCYIHGNNDFRDPSQTSDHSLYRGRAGANFGRTQNAANSGPVWQQIKVPFIYDGTSSVNYIICTFNTNVTPAGGSANDSLSVDDIEFVYSAWLTDITVAGQSINGFNKAQFTYYLDQFVDSTFRGANIGYTREADDATVTIDSVEFEDAYRPGIHYTLHVVAEDQVTTRDYHVYCYIEQTGSTIEQYTVNVLTSDETMGTVSGGGIFYEGATATLTATPAPHHHFTQWNDGVTMNPRAFTVTGDTLFTAYFALDQHYLELYTTPSYVGSVTGEGLYLYGDTAILTATAPAHFHFAYWSDGNTDNPRSYVVEGDAALWAFFELDQHTLALGSNQAEWGSVGGAGVYTYGDTATLTATPAEHYHFVAWNDSVTDNPRQLVVISDTAFTALFAIDEHLLSCATNPAGAATFVGEGMHAWGDTVELEAVANPGFMFLQWADGVSANPRTVVITGDTLFTALFSTYSFTLTTAAQPLEGGAVTGGGSYSYGAQATLIAQPAEGYHFAMWSDSIMANPRTVTVTGDATYTALFEVNPDDPEDYLITTAANNPLWGTVSGGGIYQEGTTATLYAQPAMNYHFVAWHDADNHNPRTVTVIGDATYTATFAPDQHTVSLSATPAQGGTVGGQGSYAHATSAVLVATPAQGYHFVQWSDGVSLNPRTLGVFSDTSLVAAFALNEYEVEALSAHTAWGTAYGSGTYTHGSQATLTAQPFEGCHFVQWSDGSTQNPRTVTVTCGATYTALFAQNQYTVSLQASPRQGGTLYGAGTYIHGAQATLLAQPAEGYRFLGWSDSVSDNPRTLTVTDNTSLTALFEATSYEVTVMANVNDWGTVSGGGSYAQGATAVLQALPFDGYHFVQWNDGETANPRTLSVEADALFIATFAPDAASYTITAMPNNPQYGSVSGGGIYQEGTQVVLTATPAEGYRFAGWNDGAQVNPRTVNVTADAIFIATFVSTGTNAIDLAGSLSMRLYPNPTRGMLHLQTAGTDIRQVEVYDLAGRRLLGATPQAEEATLDLADLPSGTYILRVLTAQGQQMARIVKE